MSQHVLNELQNRRDELKILISSSTDELQKVENAIAALNGISTRTNWTDGALNCIARANELLQTNLILECLVSSDDLKDERKARNYTIALSNALNNMVANATLRKVVVQGYKGHFYGLPEWFDVDGNGGLHGGYAVKLKQRTNKGHYRPVMLNENLELVEE